MFNFLLLVINFLTFFFFAFAFAFSVFPFFFFFFLNFICHVYVYIYIKKKELFINNETLIWQRKPGKLESRLFSVLSPRSSVVTVSYSICLCFLRKISKAPLEFYNLIHFFFLFWCIFIWIVTGDNGVIIMNISKYYSMNVHILKLL